LIGYAVAKGLPVFVWSNAPKTLLERTRASSRLKQSDHGWRDKDELLVEYATYGMSSQLFVQKYQLYLPDREALRRELEETLREAGQ